MSTRQYSIPEVSTGSHAGIVLEDDMVEYTSDLGNGINGENYNNLMATLEGGTTAEGGVDDGENSSSSSNDFSSRLLVHSQRSM